VSAWVNKDAVCCVSVSLLFNAVFVGVVNEDGWVSVVCEGLSSGAAN
jgi:hypothetical protein